MSSGNFELEQPISYLDKPINMLNVTEQFGGEVIGESTDQQKEHFVDLITKQRASILEMASHEKGLNLDLVHESRKQLGIPLKEIRFLNPDQFNQAMKVMDGSHRSENNETLGRYSSYLDLIVVKRDPSLEELNGPGFTESLAIHEIAHSNTEEPVFEVVEKTIGRLIMFKKSTLQFERPRSGYTERRKKGTRLFIEEGLADYERGHFVEKILGRPGGFVAPLGEDFDRTGNLPIPGKYWYMVMEENGEPRPSFMAKSAIAAATLELIINVNPEILKLLRHGRTMPEGSKLAAPAINKLQHGLYDLLNDLIIDNAVEGMTKAVHVFADVHKAFAPLK